MSYRDRRLARAERLRGWAEKRQTDGNPKGYPPMRTTTPGPWQFACDSYGKVQHSRKACVYANVKGTDGDRGDRLVTVAARIPNWDDARLIAAAPELKLIAARVLDEWHSDTRHMQRAEPTYIAAIRVLLERIDGNG